MRFCHVCGSPVRSSVPITTFLGASVVAGVLIAALLLALGCSPEPSTTASIPSSGFNADPWVLTVPSGHSAYWVVKSDVGIDEGTPEDRGHWLTFPAGSLVVLPDLHEIEGLVSSGALLPYELGPGPGDVE